MILIYIYYLYIYLYIYHNITISDTISLQSTKSINKIYISLMKSSA